MWADGQLLHNGIYRIESTLGRGGFGITYKALHINLNQYVVIKTPDETLKLDPNYAKFVERFRKEARLLAKLCAEPHLHIVRVIDLFAEGDTHCLVMDFIPGESLWQWVQHHGKLSEPEALLYIRQIGSALQVIHEAGMVHLDVTPPNIMLKENGKAVLIDFGIAAEMAPPSSFSREFGNKTFSPYELSRKGSRHPTVDVYALAASLYYAVTGQCPTKSFDRKYDGEELVSPHDWSSGISYQLNQAILQGMALEAKDRPQSIDAWLALLPASDSDDLLTPSESDTDDLSSEMGVDYRMLRDLLKAGKWKEADNKTAVVMLKAANRERAGWLRIEDIENFPCTDLRTINTLWVKYSHGRFGFSVQKRIWESVGGNPDADYETCYRFGGIVGWRVKDEWLDYSDMTFNENAPKGHLPFGGEGWDGMEVIVSSLASRLVECNINTPEEPPITKEPAAAFEKEIFISYAWRGESEEFVNRLDQVFQSQGISIVRDKRDLGYKGLIKEFMERIGRGKCVIVVISDRAISNPLTVCMN